MIEQDIEKIQKSILALKEFVKLQFGSDFNYQVKIDSILNDAKSIFNLCPFAVGDKVKLSKTPEINETTSWGWMGAKHFLVEGATGKITYREFRNGKFYFYVQFDNESWINGHTKEVILIKDRKANYTFSQDWLEKAE